MKILYCFLFILCTCTLGFGQHSVTLTWTASTDQAANPTLAYNVYRATATCASNPTFSKIATTPAGQDNYTDSTVVINTYCYEVTAVLNGQESVPSNTAQAVILPAPPTSINVTVIH